MSDSDGNNSMSNSIDYEKIRPSKSKSAKKEKKEQKGGKGWKKSETE